MNNNPKLMPVPLVTVAAEIGLSAGEFAARNGDIVFVDEATGLRSISADRCRVLIAAHHAAVQAAREKAAAERAELSARPHPIQQRVRALAAAQERWDGTDVPALARMLAEDPDSRFNKSSRHLDEMISGDTIQHRIRRRTDR